MRLRLLATPALILLVSATMFPPVAFAQDDLPRHGVGVKASTLGIGIEAATGVTSRSNVRGSFNFFDYNKAFHSDGIAYSSRLKLRSVQIMYDHHIVGGFHVSPGVLLHNGNRGLATAAVPSSQVFSLGGVTYVSNATNPVSGEATINFRNVAPMVLAGFGNLLPRGDRHFGVNFEGGIAFQGSPNLKLDLQGTACATSPTTACVNVATDPLVQSQIRKEENELIEDARAFRYYPIVSIGISWKF